jgi:uncharacterized protein YndB with AHSA1/START domain
MSEASTRHTTFVIERTYPSAPKRVFRAWADPESKARWFVGDGGWKEVSRELDFRVGGRERLLGAFEGGRTTTFDCVYHDIEPDRRIVYVYDMYSSDRRISVSLSTVVLEPAGAGTRLVYTEQAVFLDFEDGGGRERGTRAHFDRLATVLTP